MNKLELTISQEPGIIKFNFEELKAQLSAKMDEYRGAIFTDDSKQVAKGELANLRKLQKSVDDRRKDVKAQCMAPYEEFEKKVKELKAIIDEPIKLIDGQLKEMETERIRKRQEDVKSIWEEIAVDWAEYLPLDKIYDHKWDLAGTKIKGIREDMEGLVSKTQTEVGLIQNSQSDVVSDALETYKNDRNLADALAYINRYEANKKLALAKEEERRKEEEERRRLAEIERAKAEERQKQIEIQRAREEERRKVESEAHVEVVTVPALEKPFVVEDEIDELPFTQPTTVTVFYKVIATPEELEQAEMAFNSIGIVFERREK